MSDSLDVRSRDEATAQSGAVLLCMVTGEEVQAVIAPPGSRPSGHTTLPCRSLAQFADAVAELLAQAGNPPLIGAAIGAAGPEINGSIFLTHAGWRLDAAQLRTILNSSRVHLVNDFVACALASPMLGPDSLEVLHQGSPNPHAAVAAVGPEEGLGAAFLIPNGQGGWLPVPSEGGHIPLSGSGARDRAVAEQLQAMGRRTYDSCLSREGLSHIHDALRTLDGEPPLHLPLDQLAARARTGDPAAREAFTILSGWLGLFARTIVLAGGARGGLYIVSSFLTEIGDLFDAKHCIERFVPAEQMRKYVEAIPVYRVRRPMGLLGLSSFFTPSDVRFGAGGYVMLDC